MSNTIGDSVRLTLFGESHGPAIGCVLDGLPAGVALDLEAMAFHLARRRPGQGRLSTPRAESDMPELVAGVKDGKSSGGSLCILIRNADTRSSDYDADLPRPSHADLAARAKHGTAADLRGGGRFSGRLTAPLVAAGSIARSLLAKRGILIGAHILQIEDIRDRRFGDANNGYIDTSVFPKLAASHIPTLEKSAGDAMTARIDAVRMANDSVGGSVELALCGLGAGIGEPPYGGFEGNAARWLFSVPGVKALEWGAGSAFAGLRGSASNDQIGLVDGRPLPLSNRSGGVNGGISNGREQVMVVTLRPTASIHLPQRSVRLSSKAEEELLIHGRHDPCIVPRAVPALESALALAALDLLVQAEGPAWMAS